MPYGTDPFTDRYGDFKQPTVVDYDNNIINNIVNVYNPSDEEKKKVSEQYKEDQNRILASILDANPVYAGEAYQHLVCSVNSKLAWNTEKINLLKENADWLYTLYRYIKRRKKMLINK